MPFSKAYLLFCMWFSLFNKIINMTLLEWLVRLMIVVDCLFGGRWWQVTFLFHVAGHSPIYQILSLKIPNKAMVIVPNPPAWMSSIGIVVYFCCFHPGSFSSQLCLLLPKLKDVVIVCVRSGSARLFGYTVYRGFLNQVYGILQLKYGYSVYHFLWISGIQYTMLPLILGIFGWILGIFGYFGEFFSGILVYHYPSWPTLLDGYVVEPSISSLWISLEASLNWESFFVPFQTFLLSVLIAYTALLLLSFHFFFVIKEFSSYACRFSVTLNFL